MAGGGGGGAEKGEGEREGKEVGREREGQTQRHAGAFKSFPSLCCPCFSFVFPFFCQREEEDAQSVSAALKRCAPPNPPRKASERAREKKKPEMNLQPLFLSFFSTLVSTIHFCFFSFPFGMCVI